MADAPQEKPRWYHLTPGACVLGLLVLEVLLLLSERFQWFAFNRHKGYTVLIAVGSVGLAMVLMFLWFLAALVFRRRFQYSIRSLLVLMVVVAVACGWLATAKKRATAQRAAVEAIEQAGGGVSYDYEGDGSEPVELPGPAWLRELLGDNLFVDLTEVMANQPEFSDAGLEHFDGLTQLRRLWMDHTKISDAGPEHLKGLSQLQDLGLGITKISDAGLEHLKGLTQLQNLDLGITRISDAGLRHLKGLTQLRELELYETNVGDAGLEQLKGLTQLQRLDLNGTKVSDAGLEQLKGLTQLRWLNLGYTKISDAGLQQPHGIDGARSAEPHRHRSQRCRA